ncbi:MAG: MBL fold metallo-hydrolase, partial [Planctomycetes bacterium]|nr:MBL fold metallo-hydrolase [Planctomycetota bacterium]
MKVKLVGSSVGSSQIRQHLTSLIINDCVAVDAGSLGILSPVEAQRDIRHVLISHSHIDHIATLPSFLDNVFQPGKKPPTVHASYIVWESLNDHVFNDR